MTFNNNEMSKLVLDRLSKLQKLPESGFLSGGAVANTILSIIDGKEYPINDLDVFIIGTDENSKSFTTTPIRTNEEVIGTDRYENIIINPDVSNSYQIKSTKWDGLINYVFVEFKRKDIEEKNLYKRIIDSFDINCCKVGIDLSDSELIISEDFINFITGRQLECTTPVTPAHSAIRLIKKKNDLGAFLDKEKSFKFLSQFHHYSDNAHQIKLNMTLFFGEKYKNMFELYKSELSEYFDLISYAQHQKNAHRKSFLKFSKNTEWWNCYNTIDPKTMSMWYQKKLYTLNPKKYGQLDDEIKKYYNPSFSINPHYVKVLWDLLYCQGLKQKNKAIKILKERSLYPLIITNTKFHLCDFNDTNVRHFNNFISKHPLFSNLVMASKLNFQDSEKLMYIIKKLLPKEIDMFCDIITKEIINGNVESKNLTDKNFVLEKYNEIRTTLSTPFVEKLNLSDFEYKENVKELISTYDLLWGGNYMHNCIANNGFQEKITSNRVRLFIIHDETNRSAVQLNSISNGLYVVSQIYGISNSPVNKKHKLIADYLVEFLKHKHYIFESQRIIEDFKNSKSTWIDEIDKLESTDSTESLNLGIDF